MTLSRAFAAFVGPVVLGIAAALPAQAQNPKFNIGPNVGVYLPTVGKAKDAFGSTFLNFGLGIGRVNMPGKAAPSFDFSIIANRNIFSGGDNRAILIPVGVAYSGRLGALPKEPGKIGGFAPYAGASANLIVNNLRSDKNGVDSKWRYTGGGSLFVGVTFGQQAFVQARYYGMASVQGLNLSGLSLSSGFRF